MEPANRLVDRGHDVTFVAPAGFHALLDGERFGLATYPLDFSPAGMRADPEHERLMRHPFANQTRLVRYWLRRAFVADPAAARAALLRSLRGADVLVTHPTFGAATIPVARHLDIPVVVGQLFPMMMPTATRTPPLPMRNRDLDTAVNTRVWRAFVWGSGIVMYDRELNLHRQVLGVAERRGSAALSWIEATRTVVLVSRHYCGDAPADWSDWPLVGFSPWRGPSRAHVDERIEWYVTGGEPPVLVCLGTSAAAGAGRAFATIATGLRGRGFRPLLLVGEALTYVRDEPGAFEFAPVADVVPRCRAAVVSGALGTLAAALSAGVPVVVLPQLFDQVWHGRRVEELGVGTMVRRPSQVAAAVARMLADPAYTARARALGEKLRDEDGGGALVDAVEATL